MFKLFLRTLVGMAALSSFVVLILPHTALAANLYWVGSSGANTSVASNWKTTDPAGCGSGDASAAPGSSDVAIFDADCDNGATINSTFSVSSVDMKSGYTGTVTQSSGVSITTAVAGAGFVQAGGTFTGGDSAITIGAGTNNFTLSGGTFTSTSGTLTINGNFTHTAGGTFTHNSGTVTLAQGTSTIDVATSETFYNLTISPSSGTVTIATGDTVIVTGTFTLSGGDVDTGTIEAQGNFVITSGAATGSSALLNFTGTATTQTVTATGALDKWDTDITINKASGTVQLASNWTLDDSSQDLTLQSGALDLNGQTLDMGLSGGNFTQSGGTFTGGTGTLTVQNFVLSGGTFTAPGASGAMNVAANFTHTAGGTFTHNSGTVSFTNAGGTPTINVATSETFSGLTFSGTGTFTISSGDTLISVGTLSLSDGTINTGTLEAQGDVTLVVAFDGGDALLKFTGSATQTFTLTGATGDWDSNITVNKSGGQVNLASALLMDVSAGNKNLTIVEGTLDLSGNNLTAAQFTGAFVVEDGGNLQLQGGETVTTAASLPTLNSGSTVTYDGTSGPYTVKDYAYHHLIFNGSGGVFNLGATESAAGNVTITAGTFDISGFNMTVTGTFSNDDTFRLQGGETTVSLTMDTNSGTCEYDGTSSYTGLKAGNDYYHLKFNGSGGTWTQNAALDVNGNLTVTAGTLDVSGSSYGITLAGNWSNSGTFTERSGTVTFDGAAAQTLTGETFYNLTIANTAGTPSDSVDVDSSAAVTVTNTLTVSDGQFQPTTTSDFAAVTIGSDGILKPDSGATITVSGAWTNSGTFTANSGTITLDGDSQALTGATTFYNLTKNVTTSTTLTFPASTTQTISNTLTLGGASGALLLLRSSTSGTAALLNPQGTRTISFLDVKDNNNTNSTVINCSTSCTDSGNNTNWSFSATNSAPEATKASSISQASDGSGLITFKTTLSDTNADVTRLKVEYATNLGDWEDPTLDSVTTNRGSASLSNSADYQISSIDTDGGDVELTITWKSKSQISNGEDTTVYFRLIPNDSTADGGAVISDAFTVDNKAPGVSTITLEGRSSTSLTFKWVPGVTDISFQRYTVCYGTHVTHVTNCNKTAKVWTESNDPALTNQTTTTTTITGLMTNGRYLILMRAHDTKGNVTKVLRATFVPSATPLTPTLATDDIRDVSVSVYWSRLQSTGFVRGELCYGQVRARVAGSSCSSNGNPAHAAKKTYTSPTVLADVITGLKTSTIYYIKFFAYYTGFATQGSSFLTVTTCPLGQHRVGSVCVNSASPSSLPLPSPSPPPPASPTPEASPSPSATITPLSEVSPSPQPESGGLGGIMEAINTVQDFIAVVINAVQEIVETVIAVVTKTVAIGREILTAPATGILQAQAALKPVVEHPAAKVTTTVVTAAAAISVAASTAALTSTAPSMLSQLPQAASRLWQGLLGLFGFRRKKRPWGRVVDATTGQPIKGAYVQVFDHQTKKLQSTMVTNAHGAFSSLVPSGMYEFRVHKPGWTLTPQAPLLRLLAGERVYDAKPITVTEEKIIPIVLALRMIEAVPLTKYLVWRQIIQTMELFIARLSWPLVIMGLLFNSATLFAVPTGVNMTVEVFYVVLIGWKLYIRFKQQPALGVVRDVATGRPLDLAIVRLYDAVTGKLMETRTTSAEGKFLLLPSPGVYTISVAREGYEPFQESHVVVGRQHEALALAFTLKPLPVQQMGMAMDTPA